MIKHDYGRLSRAQLEAELEAARRQLASSQHDDQQITAPTRVYAVGLHWASICTSESNAAAAEYLNAAHPTGLARPWVVSKCPQFSDGLSNPRPCDHHPDTHRHVLFEVLTGWRDGSKR